jgi:hypothetical protein
MVDPNSVKLESSVYTYIQGSIFTLDKVSEALILTQSRNSNHSVLLVPEDKHVRIEEFSMSWIPRRARLSYESCKNRKGLGQLQRKQRNDITACNSASRLCDETPQV